MIHRFWYKRRVGGMLATLDWLKAVKASGRRFQSGETTLMALSIRYDVTPIHINKTVRALCEAGLIDSYCPGFEDMPL